MGISQWIRVQEREEIDLGRMSLLVQEREEIDLGRMSLNRREGLRQGKTGELALSRSAGSPSIRGGEEVQDTESLSRRVDRRGGGSVGTSLLRLSVFSVK